MQVSFCICCLRKVFTFREADPKGIIKSNSRCLVVAVDSGSFEILDISSVIKLRRKYWDAGTFDRYFTIQDIFSPLH